SPYPKAPPRPCRRRSSATTAPAGTTSGRGWMWIGVATSGRVSSTPPTGRITSSTAPPIRGPPPDRLSGRRASPRRDATPGAPVLSGLTPSPFPPHNRNRIRERVSGDADRIGSLMSTHLERPRLRRGLAAAHDERDPRY